MSIRRLLKLGSFAVALLLVLPPILLATLERLAGKSEGVFVFFGQLLAACPGKPGSYLRGAYYFGTLASCSWETSIGFGSYFTHRDCRVASRVSTGGYCVIGHVSIGPNVRLASRVSIPSGKRQHLDADGTLGPGTHFDRVSIGPDCWIGEGAIVMADVGEGCIVSAGAVVLHDAPAHSVIGGNPGRVLKSLAPAEPAAAETA